MYDTGELWTVVPGTVVQQDVEGEIVEEFVECCNPAIAPCKLNNRCLQQGDTLYANFAVDPYGVIYECSLKYSWDEDFRVQWGPNQGCGNLSVVVAKVRNNPRYPKDKVVTNYGVPRVPMLPVDAAYYPCASCDPDDEEGESTNEPVGSGRQPEQGRYMEGWWWLDGAYENIIPVWGMNNKGGLKFTEFESCDEDDIRKSVNLNASIEMYGIAPGSSVDPSHETYPYCIPAGSGHHKGWLWQPYNWCTPWKSSGDGKLACWRILGGNGECQGSIILNGFHLCDWQLAFQGSGDIRMPNVPTYYGIAASTDDYRYEFGGVTEGGKKYLSIEEYTRQECFFKSGQSFYDKWNCWQLAGTKLIELGGGGGASACAAHTDDVKHEFASYTCNGRGYLDITELTRQECFGQAPNGGAIYDRWTAWTPAGTSHIDLGLVGTPALQIHSIVGSHPPTCVSHWCGFILHLVQIKCGCGGGWKLI